VRLLTSVADFIYRGLKGLVLAQTVCEHVAESAGVAAAVGVPYVPPCKRCSAQARPSCSETSDLGLRMPGAIKPRSRGGRKGPL